MPGFAPVAASPVGGLRPALLLSGVRAVVAFGLEAAGAAGFSLTVAEVVFLPVTVALVATATLEVGDG